MQLRILYMYTKTENLYTINKTMKVLGKGLKWWRIYSPNVIRIRVHMVWAPLYETKPKRKNILDILLSNMSPYWCPLKGNTFHAVLLFITTYYVMYIKHTGLNVQKEEFPKI